MVLYFFRYHWWVGAGGESFVSFTEIHTLKVHSEEKCENLLQVGKAGGKKSCELTKPKIFQRLRTWENK